MNTRLAYLQLTDDEHRTLIHALELAMRRGSYTEGEIRVLQHVSDCALLDVLDAPEPSNDDEGTVEFNAREHGCIP